MILFRIILLQIVCCANFNVFAQENPSQEYLETKQDPYMPMLEHEKKTSPSYFFSSPNIITRQVNIDANGRNIVNDAANEPSIAIDPNNPSRMVIGWRQFDNILSNFRQAGIGISEDYGLHWKTLTPLQAGIFRSDPVLCADNQGNFYYNSLAGDFNCYVHKTNQLQNWQQQAYAHGGDKQWMAVDNTGLNSDGNLYAYWNVDYSSCLDYNFTRSTDKGKVFESCSLIPSYLTRGTITVAVDGALYAAGSRFDNHYINRSTNAANSTANPEWDFSTTVNMQGELASYNGPNPVGLLGQVWIASDHSQKASRGNLYLLSTVFRTDIGDLTDIMFSKSTDRGENWSEPISINKDGITSNWQWFGTLSVAPNGRIDVVWMDTRDNPGTHLSCLYYSYSTDAGNHWSPDQKLSEAFDPHLGYPNQGKIGDYIHMISDDTGAHLAWTATFNGEQDVYYSFIKPDTITTTSNPKDNQVSLAIYPNPGSINSQFHFQSPKNQNIRLLIYNQLGIKIESQEFYIQSGNSKLELKNKIKELIPGIYSVHVYNTKGILLATKLFVVK